MLVLLLVMLALTLEYAARRVVADHKDLAWLECLAADRKRGRLPSENQSYAVSCNPWN